MLLTLKSVTLVVFLITFSFSSFAQVKISGNVFNAKDSTVVFGASVYLDGTSIGTSTDNDGRFSLNLKKSFQASMIISSIGFEPIKIANISQYSGKNFKVFIKEKKESLETVYLEADPWSREKKLRIFKQQFLGSDRSAENCKIRNQDDLNLRYSPSKKTLFASADKALIIENRDLGYIINYNLVDFNVKFRMDDEDREWPISIYYAGTSYFKNLTNAIPNRILKKRKQAYLGSSLHFMRSLKEGILKDQDYELYRDHKNITTENVFKLDNLSEYTQVQPLGEFVRIRYDRQHWSKILFDKNFIIDDYGNFSPPTALTFSGYMSFSRISKMVPLNYQIDI